ncbi:MAG: response regulator [Patescibacteria group bacterium]|jgi:DNA-binding response OmpR family regulator
MPPKKKILVVDSDAFLANVLRANLKKDGYDADLATDGKAVADKVGTFRPDLILLDLSLPGRSGLDVLGDLRTNRKTNRIKVIVLTNDDGPTQRSSCAALEPEAYLIKDQIDFPKLSARIAKIIR